MSSSSKELNNLQIPSEETASDTTPSSWKKLDDLEIPLEQIASATNNFAHRNLIYRDAVLNVYKGNLLGSGQLGNIVVQRMLWEDKLWKDLLEFSAGSQSPLPLVGCSGDKNIIIYEHVGNESLKRDVRDPTFGWMQRLQICGELAGHSISTTLNVPFHPKPYFEMVYMICLGDLIFEVLCEKEGEEHVTPTAIEHYKKGELEKIIHPLLMPQMHQQVLPIFSKTAYDCIFMQSSFNIIDIKLQLYRALELQKIECKFHDLEIPLEEIASATNNFADGNLIYRDASLSVYKGKSLGSGQLGNIVVQRRNKDCVYEQTEDELWKDILNYSASSQRDLYVVGFSGDRNIIIYEHVVGESPVKDASDLTFNWMQILQLCHKLAAPSMFVYAALTYNRKPYFNMVYMICLGDLMFQVLCEKKGEEHVTLTAIKHYENGELENIVHPHLKEQMHEQSFTIFSNLAYECIVKQPPSHILVGEALKKALKLQVRHERYVRPSFHFYFVFLQLS